MLDALKSVRPVTHRGQITNFGQFAKKNKMQFRQQDKQPISTLNSTMYSQSASSTFHKRHKSTANITLNTTEQIKQYQDYLKEIKSGKDSLTKDLQNTMLLYEIKNQQINEQDLEKEDLRTIINKKGNSMASVSLDPINNTLNGSQTERRSGALIEQSKNPNYKMRVVSSRLNSSRINLNQTQSNMSINLQEKVMNFLSDQQTNIQANQIQDKLNKKKANIHDFELKLQKIEKIYREFEDYFEEYRKEKLNQQVQDINQQQQSESDLLDSSDAEETKDQLNKFKSGSLILSYDKIINKTLIKDQEIHNMIESKFYKLKKIRKEVNALHSCLGHVNYNRIVLDQQKTFITKRTSQCQCNQNKLFQKLADGGKRVQFIRSMTRPASNHKNGQKQTLQNPEKTVFEMPQHLNQGGGLHQKQKSSVSMKSIRQNLEVNVISTSNGKDLRIQVQGYAPITINLNSLSLEQSQSFLVQPMNEYLNQVPAENLNNVFMSEIERQNKELKIVEQFQKSFINNSVIYTEDPTLQKIRDSNPDSLNQTNAAYNENQDMINTDRLWKANEQHVDRQKSRSSRNNIETKRNEAVDPTIQSQKIFENDIMKSLFDLEMCVVCKYQKILYKDFIYQIHRVDQSSQESVEEMNKIIKDTISGYLERTLQFNNHKVVQRIVAQFLKTQQRQLLNISKILPVHALECEKSLKFLGFMFSMMLMAEQSDYKYTKSENELLQLELLDVKQQLSEANELLVEYKKDRQVVIKDIERDIQDLNQNFNSHSKHQAKLRDNIEKEVRQIMQEIQGENKTNNDSLQEMMDIILKKFEIIKYSLQKSNNVSTQTIIAGSSRVNNQSGQNSSSGGIVVIKNKNQSHNYWKFIDIYRPLIASEIQKRRLYEMYELQSISEELVQFISRIKLKKNDLVQVPLTKLPIQDEIQKSAKKGVKKTKQSEQLQMLYSIDKKANPIMNDILLFGFKDDLLNLMSEFFMAKNQNLKIDLVNIDINHFLLSLENAVNSKNSMSSKMILTLLNYEEESTMQSVDESNQEASVISKIQVQNQKSSKGLYGKLDGQIINLNEVVNQKVGQLLFTSFLIDNFDDASLALHRLDLRNKKLCLRVAFLLFERMLGRSSLTLHQDFLDGLMYHYAQGDDYKEASSLQKFYSLIAIQIIMKNKSKMMHYNFLIDTIYGLVTTQTQVSIQDLIGDDFTSDVVFNKVQQQFEREKLERTTNNQFSLYDTYNGEEFKSDQPSFSAYSQSGFSHQRKLASIKKAALIKTVTNATTSPVKTRFDHSDVLSRNPINNLSEIVSGSGSPSPNVLKSKFDLNEDKIMELEVQNHITDQSIREQIDQKKDILIQTITIEKFIRLMNYQKIFFPNVKEALTDYKTYYIQHDEFKRQEMRIEKPANLVKTEQQFLSFQYIMRQGMLLQIANSYLENLPFTLESFFTILRRYLINERSYLLLKQKQFYHIIDELKMIKLDKQLKASNNNIGQALDKLEEFQKQLDEKKTDGFLTFKYKEIKDVIEDKWYLIKELNYIKEDFLSLSKDIEKRKTINRIKLKSMISEGSPIKMDRDQLAD
ncbi:UNKNOWN [Stylonychia lemnae]|uniref:Uncharacterized protein n=1 Tax=Stylonychia lemnae TaxID=5949 RepID=A0A078AII5_STYLE|nr:UNKNOWN [Stylonychia lemnae]|eukprot:CDW81307.1 UNKNOWN [Stylonychia lemnae]